jgi:hypothetical protein
MPVLVGVGEALRWHAGQCSGRAQPPHRARSEFEKSVEVFDRKYALDAASELHNKVAIQDGFSELLLRPLSLRLVASVGRRASV